MTDSSQSTKQRKRSVVFWLFVLLSVPLIIVVIGYASGYRFDTHSRTFSVTSLISVYTEVEGAAVSLNGEKQTELTPFMETVIPGEYTVTVERDGYQAWEKQTAVTEGHGAVFSKILLFAVTPTIQDVAEPQTRPIGLRDLTTDEQTHYTNRGFVHAETLRMLPTGPRVVIVDPQGDTTWLLASDSTTRDDAQNIGPASTIAEWNADQTQLLTMSDSELWTYDLTTQKSSLWRRQGTPLLDATWSTNSSYIFVADENEIAAMEIDNRDSRQRWVIATVSGASQLFAQKKQLQFTANNKTFALILER